MPGPVPDGGGRGGGGFDNDPTLVVSPPSPFNLGNIPQGVTTSFALTLRNGGSVGTTVTVTGVNFSDPQWTTTDVFPFTFSRTHVLHLTVTPTGLGPLTVTLMINNNADPSQVNYVVNATSLDPFAGGIVKVVPGDPNLPVGQMLTTKVGDTSTTNVGVENVGTAGFNLLTAAITAGGPIYTLLPTVTLPVLINPGDPPVFFPIVFAPDDVGVSLGTLEFTTDLIAPQDTVDVPLSGLGVPFIAVSILDNGNRVILLGFDGGELKFPQINTYDYQDLDSVLDFNGVLWQSPGMEKTIERIEILYENIGVCTGIVVALTVLRPSMGADHYDVVTKTISIGTALADGTDRSAYVDMTASGEIIFLSITRTKATGPCALTAVIPHFADRGEKVGNV